MSMHRRNASRDGNEPEIVQVLEKAGYFVTRISGAGVPDLLVIKPGLNVPVDVVEDYAEALRMMGKTDIALMEVKMPGEPLTPAQRKFHQRALGVG